MTHPSAPGLPLLPLRHGVLLPGGVTPIPVGRKRSVAMANDLEPGDELVLAIQYDSKVDDPAIADLHPMAVVARLRDKRRRPRRGSALTCEAVERVRLKSLVQADGYFHAEYEPVAEQGGDSAEAMALADSLRTMVSELIDDRALRGMLDGTREPGLLADRVAGLVDMSRDDKLEVLRELDVVARLRLAARLLKEARARAELKERIDSEVRQNLSAHQREALLRQQLEAIRKELGEGDSDDEIAKLRKRVDEADLPEEVRETAERELDRLGRMQGHQAESGVIRNYLEWIIELPWNVRADTHQDIDGMSETLDEDHYGLEEVKRRILEHMAVLKLSARRRGTILALAGPPGVGKTSLAQSIARATGRPLARASLGGVRDEAEVRGHRRTYVGALPGRIISALRKAKAKNPVMVLDEIDKLGRGWAGDPEAALLEVLDPEQNDSFTDHYLELPFDLSEVLFIATGNDLSALSPPLRDRLEIIDMSGYTVEEKIHIGRDHLWPKQLDDHGLGELDLSLSDEALSLIITDYTREAGVRQLDRELAKVCRSLALAVARSDGEADPQAQTNEDNLRKILGRPRFLNERAEGRRPPGVAAGLAWTPVGGDVLYVETTRMPGTGKLEITGHLGEVMDESARAALAYLRSHAAEHGVDSRFLESSDLHIHVPAGGVPKDGPSAGVTIFTALASLLTDREVRPDTAMTGEATLRGRVLPVGGIKAKILAAHRAGFTRVILPRRNEHDLEDVPEAVLAELEIVLADDMREVLAASLEPTGPAERATTVMPDTERSAATGALS